MVNEGKTSYEVTKADGSSEQVRADAAEIAGSGALVLTTRTHQGQTIDLILAIAHSCWRQVRRLNNSKE